MKKGRKRSFDIVFKKNMTSQFQTPNETNIVVGPRSTIVTTVPKSFMSAKFDKHITTVRKSENQIVIDQTNKSKFKICHQKLQKFVMARWCLRWYLR